jgi:hypothetical protein
MKTPEAMKGRKLLIRLHEPGIKRVRPDGLYMATAKVTKYYTSNKWVDLEYVVGDEEARLHLDRKFYQKDCTPVSFPDNRRLRKQGGFHCGWTMYREGVADIGEDVYELMKTANATP